MQTGGLLYLFPLWTLFPLTVVVAMLSDEVGYRFARYRRLHSEEEHDAPVGAMVGATLGLLAFMLAFTFGLAGTRFEDRRQVPTSPPVISTSYPMLNRKIELKSTNVRVCCEYRLRSCWVELFPHFQNSILRPLLCTRRNV
jgi:hypothetical protein